MKRELNKDLYPDPLILNCFKPAGVSSYDVVRKIKRSLPRGFGRIGHFGTLDPFASGVLMIGVAGAMKLNEYVHDLYPKTYYASGILGIETPTGDLTSEISAEDKSEYLNSTIASFSCEFIQSQLRKKFLGDYLQAPHVYSAAKFDGKKLHQWAKEGVEIQKAPKLRQILQIDVLSYSFPRLEIRYQVSSGTYIRTLFSDCARYLGTLGVLEQLERSQVANCRNDAALMIDDAQRELNLDMKKLLDVRDVLQLGTVVFAPKEERLFKNGVKLALGREQKLTRSAKSNMHWVENQENKLLGMCQLDESGYTIKVNF